MTFGVNGQLVPSGGQAIKTQVAPKTKIRAGSHQVKLIERFILKGSQGANHPGPLQSNGFDHDLVIRRLVLPPRHADDFVFRFDGGLDVS
jgi:hypothetical protein